MNKINTKEWKKFKISDLFYIKGSTTTAKKDICFEGEGYPYVTTAGTNNGVCGYSNTYTENGNVITIDSAVVGTAFYQKYNFLASDHVEKLIPKFEMNEYIALFFVSLLNITAKLYGYAYIEKRSQTALYSEIIALPIDTKGNPDYKYMESYMKKIEAKAKNTIANLKLIV